MPRPKKSETARSSKDKSITKPTQRKGTGVTKNPKQPVEKSKSRKDSTKQTKTKSGGNYKKKKTARKESSSSSDSEEDTKIEKRSRPKQQKGAKSWRRLTFYRDVNTINRAHDDNIRTIEEFVADGENTDMDTDTNSPKNLCLRNIAAPGGASGVLMRKAFIRTKTGHCSRLLNNMIKMCVKNAAYDTASVMLMLPGNKKSKKVGENDAQTADHSTSSDEDDVTHRNWIPKRCMTEHVRIAVEHQTGTVLMDIMDDISDMVSQRSKKATLPGADKSSSDDGDHHEGENMPAAKIIE